MLQLKNFKAVFFALSAAFLFGVSTPLAKILAGQIKPLFLASLLYLGTGVGFAILSTWPSKNNVSTKEIPILLAVVCAGGIFAPICLMLGLAQSSATTASLLLNLEAVFTALIAWVCFKEICNKKVIAGMICITAGGAMLCFKPDEKLVFNPGQILIVMACLGWAIDNNLTRKIAALDPRQIAMVKGLVAGLVNLALAIASGEAWPQPSAIAWAMPLGFISYGLSLVLYVLALRGLGSARSSAYFATAPFLGALLSLMLFHEALSWQIYIAALLMAIGVYLHLSEHQAFVKEEARMIEPAQ